MKNTLKNIRNAFLAFWYAWRGHPLNNAREDHQQTVRAVFRTKAEIDYHQHLVNYFGKEADTMNPHDDWHLFAQLKDKWTEHKVERDVEKRRMVIVEGRAEASKARLRKIEART